MKVILLAILALVLLVCVIIIGNSGERAVVYDCRIAEISPDIPPEVREACRRMFLEEIKKQRSTSYNI